MVMMLAVMVSCGGTCGSSCGELLATTVVVGWGE